MSKLYLTDHQAADEIKKSGGSPFWQIVHPQPLQSDNNFQATTCTMQFLVAEPRSAD